MIADIVFVAVTTVIMTLLTAGLLLTVIQLMILVTRLESAPAELPDCPFCGRGDSCKKERMCGNAGKNFGV